MSKVTTVAVEDGDSYRIINESDFDSRNMSVYTGDLPTDVATGMPNRNPDGTYSGPAPTPKKSESKAPVEAAKTEPKK